MKRAKKGWKLLAVVVVASLTIGAHAAETIKLRAGWRGVTLPVKDHQLVNVNPGDHVDVMVTFEAELKDRKEKVTATILQNVMVLKVIKEHGFIVLSLNPKEAQYAALSIDVALSIWIIARPA